MKKTAYIITILANIILLAYAVVPHHHHKFQVCVISEHCQTNDFDDTENHHHDSQTKSNNCLLSQAILLPIGNNTKEDQSIVYNYGFDVFIKAILTKKLIQKTSLSSFISFLHCAFEIFYLSAFLFFHQLIILKIILFIIFNQMIKYYVLKTCILQKVSVNCSVFPNHEKY